jgi:beta-lactamase superfamily II metal-dependent hydrolase
MYLNLQFVFWLLTGVALAAETEQPGLEIVMIDTEGGAATLVVTAAREAVLVDTGNPGTRDAERIVRAVKEVGLNRIDHLVTTHWHSDHYGGVAALAERLPIEKFYDRGIPGQLAEDPQYFPLLIQNYKKVAGNRRTELKPGDALPLRQAEGMPETSAVCLTSARRVIDAKDRTTKNACCGQNRPKPRDGTDNAMSISLLFRFGPFTFLDCGDLTWNVEYDLVCPYDPIGKIDVFQVTHHGLDTSNNPVLVNTVQPIVAIFNNGARKGAAPAVMHTLRSLPELKGIYQLHRNETVGSELNASPAFIANSEAACQGEYVRVRVAREGKSYTVQAGAKGATTRFATRELPGAQ